MLLPIVCVRFFLFCFLSFIDSRFIWWHRCIRNVSYELQIHHTVEVHKVLLSRLQCCYSVNFGSVSALLLKLHHFTKFTFIFKLFKVFKLDIALFKEKLKTSVKIHLQKYSQEMLKVHKPFLVCDFARLFHIPTQTRYFFHTKKNPRQ